MTSIGQFWSLTWCHLRSRSRVGSCRSCCISVDAPWRDKHIGTNPMSVSLFNQRLFTKTMLVTSDDLSRGHIAPYFRFYLSITFDWIATQTWEWYQWVCLVNVHWLICNMTYLNHHMTLTRDDLRSNFKIDLSRLSSIPMFRSGSTRESHWCQNNCSVFIAWTFIHEKLFFQKTLFWPLMASRAINTDLSSNPVRKRW